jgi:hypothetical protein
MYHYTLRAGPANLVDRGLLFLQFRESFTLKRSIYITGPRLAQRIELVHAFDLE